MVGERRRASGVEDVLEEELGVGLQADDAHEDQQARPHQPEEIAVLARVDPEGAQGDRAQSPRQAPESPAPVGDHGDGDDHGDQQHRRHGVEGEVVVTGGGEDAGDQEPDQRSDQVAHPVEGTEGAEVPLGHGVGPQSLVGRLGGVRGHLEQEVVQSQQPEVGADEGHEHQEEGRADGARDDVGPPPAPGHPSAVGDRADHRLPDHRDHGAEALQEREGGPLVGLAHHPGDDRRQHLRAQGVPEPADGDPVEAEQDQSTWPDGVPSGPPGGRRGDVHGCHG